MTIGQCVEILVSVRERGEMVIRERGIREKVREAEKERDRD